jgi:DNA-binding transcriptional LysR family regulator
LVERRIFGPLPSSVNRNRRRKGPAIRVEQLQYVTAVIRCGSFRRAAEEINISQPALSESVQKLEAELGVRILARHRSGTTITAEGRELLPHMLYAIDADERLRQAAEELAAAAAAAAPAPAA